MNTGELKHKINIQKHVAVVDDDGHPVDTWTDFITVWSAKRGLSGREYYAAAAVQSETDIVFTIRYREGISTEMRIVEGSDIEHPYNIKSVIDKEGNKSWLEIRAQR